MGSPITWCRPPRCHSDPARRRPSGRIRWPNCGPIRFAAGVWADSRRNRRRARRRRPAGSRIESPWRFGAQANAPARRRFALAVEAEAEDGEEGFRSRIVAASFCNAAHPKLKGTGLAPLAASWRAAGRHGCFPILSFSSGIPPLLRRL